MKKTHVPNKTGSVQVATPFHDPFKVEPECNKMQYTELVIWFFKAFNKKLRINMTIEF